MKRNLVCLLSACALMILLATQRATAQQQPVTSPGGGATRILVTGDAIVRAQPDTAIISIAVVTQNRSALAAQQENARLTETVIRALRAAAGTGAEIQTGGYSIQPQRVYRENQPPTITGYEARNAVTVTLGDLTRVGTVIDAASQAGANTIDGISFTLRRDRPARDQALTDATREAVSKAQTLAQALGGRVVRIVEVQEAGMVRPLITELPINGRVAFQRGESTPTPIEVGSLEIRAQVQLVAEIEMSQR